MELPTCRCSVAYVENTGVNGRRQHSSSSRYLSTDPDQGRLPSQMQSSNRLFADGLAFWAQGCVSDGAQTRSILHWLLLGLDDGLVRRRRYELDDHCSPVGDRCDRKTRAPRRTDLKTEWRLAGRNHPNLVGLGVLSDTAANFARGHAPKGITRGKTGHPDPGSRWQIGCLLRAKL